MKIIMKRLLLVPLLLIAASAFTQDASSVTGRWYTENKESVVKIYKKNGKYYGKLVWLEEPRDEDGNLKRDDNNPVKSKRNQKLAGLEILKDFEYSGNGKWKGGTIYDPDNGKTYKAQIELNGDGKLDLRGYIGVPAFGRTTVWKRY
ncbi:MAG: DUF2147 domain-containing protein [Bacteroidales bacterium]|nr:DUF2147 domain-containing protein [Bacteroidales bacterium]